MDSNPGPGGLPAASGGRGAVIAATDAHAIGDADAGAGVSTSAPESAGDGNIEQPIPASVEERRGGALAAIERNSIAATDAAIGDTTGGLTARTAAPDTVRQMWAQCGRAGQPHLRRPRSSQRSR